MRTDKLSRARRAGAALAAVITLAGCSTIISGKPSCPGCGPNTEPSFPTPRQTATAAPTPTSDPRPAPSRTPAPSGEVLPAQNGYVFIETKSGKTRCQLDEQEVGCESDFVNAPEIDGLPANGVRLSTGGDISWVLGNLGAIPAVTLDYRTYSAVGWTIDADVNGTRFTNDGTGHGMVISVEGVQSF